jgi:hypothetical protein
MHVMETALLSNASTNQRRMTEGEQAYFERAAGYAPALRRAFAIAAAIGIVVIALQVASAGALRGDGIELAALSIAG